MNKISGKKSDFQLISEDASRIVLDYGQSKVSKSLYEWYEVYFYKTKQNIIGLQDVKDAIIGDINKRTDEKILSGFVWNDINVWLSPENQRNFSEAQRIATENPSILPITFKLGEDENGAAVYHSFESVEDLNSFYFSAFAYVNQCLNDGWAEKDAIDWKPYEDALAELEAARQAAAEAARQAAEAEAQRIAEEEAAAVAAQAEESHAMPFEEPNAE